MQFMTFRRWSSKGLTRDFCLLLTPRLLFGGWDDVFDVSSQQRDLVKPRVLWLWVTRPSNRRVSRKPTGRWNKLEKKDCRMGLNLSEVEQKWEESFWVLCAAAKPCSASEFLDPAVVFSRHHSPYVFKYWQSPCWLPSPPTMLTFTSRPRPTTRSTVASRGPRSSWRSGTAVAWRGWGCVLSCLEEAV